MILDALDSPQTNELAQVFMPAAVYAYLCSATEQF